MEQVHAPVKSESSGKAIDATADNDDAMGFPLHVCLLPCLLYSSSMSKRRQSLIRSKYEVFGRVGRARGWLVCFRPRSVVPERVIPRLELFLGSTNL